MPCTAVLLQSSLHLASSERDALLRENDKIIVYYKKVGHYKDQGGGMSCLSQGSSNPQRVLAGRHGWTCWASEGSLFSETAMGI